MIPNAQPRLRTKLSALYRRCRCFSCTAHPDHAVLLRRATAIPSRTAYNKAATTLFYSSVIATGAALDSKCKQKRRKSLDIAIEEAEGKIATEQRRQASRLASLGIAVAEKEDEAPIHVEQDFRQHHNAKESNQESDPAIDGSWTRALGAILAKQLSEDQSLDREVGRSLGLRGGTSPNGLADLVQITQEAIQSSNPRASNPADLALNSLVNPEVEIRNHFSALSPYSVYGQNDARFVPQNHSPKRLAMKEYAVAILAAKMLLAAHDVPLDTRLRLSDRLPELFHGYLVANREQNSHRLTKTVRLNLPCYSLGLDRAAELGYRMNEAITSILESHIAGTYSKSQMYAKLAQNLLYSPAPPTRNHFSNMIKLLGRAGEMRMASKVIDCFQACKERPDEVSIVAMLVHYRQSGDSRRFKDFHAMLEGTHTDAFGNSQALKLTNPPGRHVETVLPWIQPHGDQGQARIKVIYSPSIWSALISGYVKFDDMDTAQDLLKQMVGRGHTPDAHNFFQIMLRAVEKAEFETALSSWNTFAQNFLPTDPSARLAHGSIEHRCFRVALQACKAALRPEAFKQIYQSALGHGLRMHALLPRHLPDHLGRHTGAQASLQRRVLTLQENYEILERDYMRFKLQVYATQLGVMQLSYNEIKQALLDMSLPVPGSWAHDIIRPQMTGSVVRRNKRHAAASLTDDNKPRQSWNDLPRRTVKFRRIKMTVLSDASGIPRRVVSRGAAGHGEKPLRQRPAKHV